MSSVTKKLQESQSNEAITNIDAREALLGCFVAIHGQSLKNGAKVLGKEYSDEEVEKIARTQMEVIMSTAFENPSPEELRSTKEKLDVKMNFAKVPAELRSMHDKTCNIILSKIK